MPVQWSRLKSVAVAGSASVCILAAIVSLTQKGLLKWLFVNTSYYIFTAMLVVWGVCLLRSLKASDFHLQGFLIRNWHFLLSAALLTGLIFLSSPVDFRTLNDEVVLLSVSQSFLFFRTPHEIGDALNYWGSFTPLTTHIPIRPLLFPYALHLVHQVLGYGHLNPFLLNAFILFLFLSGMAIWIKQFSDFPTAYAAMVLSAVHPVITLYGTGGGYDLAALALLCMSLALSFGFFRKPSQERFAFLWITLVLMANVRHESCIYSAIIGMSCLGYYWRTVLKRQVSLIVASALFMLPYVWQRILVVGRYENPPDIPLFSLGKFVSNSYDLLSNFLNLDFFLPFSGLLNAIAIIILGVVVVQAIRGELFWDADGKRFLGLVALCLTANLVIILSHHAGTFSHPTQARFFMVFSLATALSPIGLKIGSPRLIGSRGLLVFALMAFIVYHPVAMNQGFLSTLMENRSYRAGRSFLPPASEANPLIITRWPVQYSCLGYSAMDFDYANRHKEKILVDLKRHFYDRILIFQQKSIQTNQAVAEQVLKWGLEPHVLEQTAIYYDKLYLNISKIDVSDLHSIAPSSTPKTGQ